MNKEKYVSEVITQKEVESWKQKESIRILGKTGAGKTYWAINVLAPVCKKTSKSILYLVHRVSLKKQIVNDTIDSGVDDIISVKTYQSIIYQYKKGTLDLSGYDVIVYDEFQFLINDSDFISDTEIIYDLIKKDKLHTKVFISANNMDFGLEFSRHYVIGVATKDISNRVNMTYLLKKKSNISGVIENILDNTEDDKIFCYVNNNEMLEELYYEFEDNTMLYVSSNSPLSKLMNEKYADTLSTTNKLPKRVLLCSSAIDAGVSLKDDKVKHIIVDERDVEQLYQVIGRKRLAEGETIDLYIVDIGNQRLAGYSTALNRKLDMISQFEENKNLFCQKYGRDNLDNTIFYNDLEGVLQLNKMAKYKLNSLREQFNLYFDLGYQKAIEKLFNIKLINLSMEKKQLELSDYLDSIVGKKLETKEQKEKLINAIDYRFNGRQYRTANKLNQGLIQEKMNYLILNKKSNSKRYWIVEKNNQ